MPGLIATDSLPLYSLHSGVAYQRTFAGHTFYVELQLPQMVHWCIWNTYDVSRFHGSGSAPSSKALKLQAPTGSSFQFLPHSTGDPIYRLAAPLDVTAWDFTPPLVSSVHQSIHSHSARLPTIHPASPSGKPSTLGTLPPDLDVPGYFTTTPPTSTNHPLSHPPSA